MILRHPGRKFRARAWGGFHHPAQGYRHIQMDAAVTVYGDLTGRTQGSPQSAALDLIRSYAHDCLHYATFRRYRLTDRGEIARVQYGINFRHSDGRTYSAPDDPGDGPTRNLGIVMEGATDAEATIQAALSSDHPYARSLGQFSRTVTARYRALLAGLDREPAGAHGQFTAAMISGDLAALGTWLDMRRGPGSFAQLFRASSFDEVPGPVS